MTRSIIVSTFGMITTAILCFHPLPNETANTILYIASLMLYVIMLGIAYGKEQGIKNRIKALEDKLKNEELQR